MILLKPVFIIAIVAVAMVGVMIPSIFADHYSEIKINNAKTQIIEYEKSNLIRISLTIDNDSTQQFTPYYAYLTKHFVSYYESIYASSTDKIGYDACPYVSPDVSPGLEKDYIFCFEVRLTGVSTASSINKSPFPVPRNAAMPLLRSLICLPD